MLLCPWPDALIPAPPLLARPSLPNNATSANSTAVGSNTARQARRRDPWQTGWRLTPGKGVCQVTVYQPPAIEEVHTAVGGTEHRP